MKIVNLTNSKGFKYNIYYVEVTQYMKGVALDFATKIIRSDNQYSRLLPHEVWESKDIALREKIEIQRTYVGKIGELVFCELLKYKNKQFDTTGMFDIYDGQENVDEFDFITKNGKSVDVKTGFRPIHTRLLVNVDQFNNIPKDYYVGVKLNGVDSNFKSKLIDLDSITEGIIYGYSEYGYMNEYAQVNDFGEGPARYLPYKKLLGIDRLLKEF